MYDGYILLPQHGSPLPRKRSAVPKQAHSRSTVLPKPGLCNKLPVASSHEFCVAELYCITKSISNRIVQCFSGYVPVFRNDLDAAAQVAAVPPTNDAIQRSA